MLEDMVLFRAILKVILMDYVMIVTIVRITTGLWKINILEIERKKNGIHK